METKFPKALNGTRTHVCCLRGNRIPNYTIKAKELIWEVAVPMTAFPIRNDKIHPPQVYLSEPLYKGCVMQVSPYTLSNLNQ